jgi:hypothetical protein
MIRKKSVIAITFPLCNVLFKTSNQRFIKPVKEPEKMYYYDPQTTNMYPDFS